MKAIPPVEARELERLRYWQGQTLRSQDFRDQVAIEAQRRWWHARAMHNAYGVASGFEVKLDGLQVHVDPGVAYDCFGREIVLECRSVLRVPEADKPLTLLVRYKETRSYPQKNQITATCLPCAGSMYAETPEFLWKPSSSVQPHDGVPLGGVIKLSGQIGLDDSFRPAISRPLSRPRVASGATIPGATPWQRWNILIDDEEVLIGLQVTIDTSAAGFTKVPCYFAWLQSQLGSGKTSLFLFAPFTHIDETTTASFVFRLVLFPSLTVPSPVANYDLQREFLSFTGKQQQPFVSWLGIEPARGYPHESHTAKAHYEHT